MRDAFSSSARLLDEHSDDVHGRSVFTLAAEPAALTDSLVAGAAVAIELIDLRRHSGAHPRIGALDVCPVVWPRAEDETRARELALDVAARIGELGIPVFFYGVLASAPERVERAYFRSGGVDPLAERLDSGDLAPDFGPPRLHPSAGATLVTARPPLAAFNVELRGADLDAGRAIAARVREDGGGPPGVRAIAIDLGDGRIQISTNVHDPIGVPLARVVEDIRRHGLPFRAAPDAAELVGLVPQAALAGYPEDVPIRGFDPALQTIEAALSS